LSLYPGSEHFIFHCVSNYFPEGYAGRNDVTASRRGGG